LLESQGNAIVGFHGRVGSCVDSIGEYYAPFSPYPPPTEKLEGQGGDGGDSWDDGAFLNVKKVCIGQGQFGIVSVKFEYENDASEVVVGDEHGKATLLGYEEVMITALHVFSISFFLSTTYILLELERLLKLNRRNIVYIQNKMQENTGVLYISTIKFLSFFFVNIKTN